MLSERLFRSAGTIIAQLAEADRMPPGIPLPPLARLWLVDYEDWKRAQRNTIDFDRDLWRKYFVIFLKNSPNTAPTLKYLRKIGRAAMHAVQVEEGGWNTKAESPTTSEGVQA